MKQPFMYENIKCAEFANRELSPLFFNISVWISEKNDITIKDISFELSHRDEAYHIYIYYMED